MTRTELKTRRLTVPAKKAKRAGAQRPIWEEQPTFGGSLAKSILIGAIVIAVLLPLWMVVITSLSTEETIRQAGGLVIIPQEITFGAYRQVFAGGVVTRAIGVSLFVAIVGTAIAVLVTILGAYGLSKPSMVFFKPILFTALITMFFGAGIIPTYLVVSSLGLINSLWALILPTAVSAFNVLVMRSFFMGIDASVLESARIDGAGEWRILFTMVVPMSKAVIAVVALFYGVAFWNAFFNAMLYINDNRLWPLQLVLRSYVLQGTAQQGNVGEQIATGGAPLAPIALQMALVVIAMLPILVAYPFVQRHLKNGVMIGAVKG
ncbi:carbohydrate ABC transporter permease [Microbacterium sp. MPKO10]|uniref:carbohydrate ABC transporter permease n=1 Tax=Microbacterium sp. MPKO10 TaxID=2989818 RepID=UPI0022365E7C|nr:carbohydrate ABC transporter permease [Microbacterium sp. MPKO10]MCW4459797.1 carbohydrate ABC transporter permease [Microbacterium sp. MPKO10]